MQEKLKKNSSLYSIIFIFSVICRICVKYAHLVHLLHFYLPQGANFQKFYSKGSILPGSACTCREKRSGKEGKHPSTSTSSLVSSTALHVLMLHQKLCSRASLPKLCLFVIHLLGSTLLLWKDDINRTETTLAEV